MRHFPAHSHYVEPWGGGAGVLLCKRPLPRGGVEVYNDLDDGVVTFFRVLREQPDALIRAVSLTPFSRREFETACELHEAGMQALDDVERARRLVVRSHQGFGSAAATRRHRSGWRGGVVRSWTTPTDDWDQLPAVLSAVAARLARVTIEHCPALDCIGRHGKGPGVLIYADPPYLRSTRATDSACYGVEMTNEEHAEALTALVAAADRGCAVVVSGYGSELYDAALADWRRVEFETTANGQTGAARRTECLWLSPLTRHQHDLFAPRSA
ncbi:MAG: DNA adenine methylase [Bacteroidota bacterium]